MLIGHHKGGGLIILCDHQSRDYWDYSIKLIKSPITPLKKLSNYFLPTLFMSNPLLITKYFIYVFKITNSTAYVVKKIICNIVFAWFFFISDILGEKDIIAWKRPII